MVLFRRAKEKSSTAAYKSRYVFVITALSVLSYTCTILIRSPLTPVITEYMSVVKAKNESFSEKILDTVSNIYSLMLVPTAAIATGKSRMILTTKYWIRMIGKPTFGSAIHR